MEHFIIVNGERSSKAGKDNHSEECGNYDICFSHSEGCNGQEGCSNEGDGGGQGG